MIQWSSSGLGKIIVILIILFYTSIDKLYGMLVCLLFILFYQSDFYYNYENRNNETENFEPILDSIVPHQSIKPLEPISYNHQYEMPEINVEYVKNFKQEHCEKGHLVNKGQKVKIDIAEHIYPEISFINEKCNICDARCNFDIVKKQMDIIEKIKPKSCR